MYHCHIHFYLTGHRRELFDAVKGMAPLEHFTHEFSESDIPEKDLLARGDVILANLQGMDAEQTLLSLVSSRKKGSQLILLADSSQIPLLTGHLDDVRDIWTLPMSKEELSFRFLRWQQACKTEKDFWETSHFLDATINHVPTLIWYKTKEGIHEKVNDCFCETVGKTKQQVEGRDHYYIWDVDPNDPANNDCMESDWTVMNSRQTCVSEELVKSGDGMKLLTTYKSPLYNLDGSVMGTVGMAIDVTQERAYEKEITQKNQTLETIFTALECGVMCHTLDGSRIISINKSALDILGYDSPEELMNDGFNMVASSVVDEDKDWLRKAILSLKKEGDSISVEYRLRHKSKKLLYIMGNIKLIRQNGNLAYQRFLLDCTAQKQRENSERIERERRQMELVHALTADYSIVCFFDLDTDTGNLLQMDNESASLLGDTFVGEISLRRNMSHYIDNYVYEEDREMMRDAFSPGQLKENLANRKQYYANFRAIQDGEIKYSQLKAVRIGTWDTSHGMVLGLRSVDAETRYEMEQKGLLEDALLQANRASKAKSTFLSNMSHDIRTPMNAIVGFTALAMTHIDHRDQVEEYLKKIMTSGNHLLSLINDILDMSRIESGKMHLDEKEYSLPDILHGLRNIILADIRAKQLELYIDAVDVINEEIYCDRLRLNQVLLNLLSNAIKYTGAGGIVTMRVTEKTGAPAGYAAFEFSIKDTGIGMSEEFIKHIFEPFERERNSTISGIQGTGLGMAITKNIIDMMNGSIEVKSEQGNGTEFIVSLTFRLNEVKKEAKDIPELKNCRALVVDDDFNTCDSVSYMLQQIGMRAEWTLSGREAVLRTRQALMRGDTYCVYIIDWLLPDMNGVEITRRIRKEMGENVPIIILTAYDWADIEDEAKEAGVTAFCSKPLFMSELRSCLHSVVNTDQESPEDGTKPRKLHSGRILLAEDNELNQEIATAILGEAGFQIEIAENGQIAVDMLSRSQPGYYQLILMDIQMPVMNGYDAAKAIRKLTDSRLASLPILAMTANAFEEDRLEALKCGMNGHIAKPINIDLLFETLDNILD
ncbi:MAG: response regulator [Lachnospiraceae bacterium]|uniref:hybrid sensor histidine kinase/response regulator n=1 Tax=uncultured Acetatifactor sp. TaxID=1671927 RepID=UPI00262F9CBA|nr:response regulator [uncultured Acetatifactor sp.]MCI8787538.1 response regulator [Lachnospiraceae bacterium]